MMNERTHGKKRVLVLGAGSSGLAVAWGLAVAPGHDVTVLESSGCAGGLARTIEHRGLRFDIGPHRLSPQLPEVVDNIRGLLGEDLRELENRHGVHIHGKIYHYPPRIGDLLNRVSLLYTLKFGSSWFAARCRSVLRTMSGRKTTDMTFDRKLLSEFGRAFCEEVIFPMIVKVWGTTDLHQDFARIRFELPTFSRMLRRVLKGNDRTMGGTFFYPARGFGQITDAMTRFVTERGGVILYHAHIHSIEAASLRGPFTVRVSVDGDMRTMESDVLVSTISNRSLLRYFADSGLVSDLLHLADHFTSRTMRLAVMTVRNFRLPSRIIIFPENSFIFNRISDMSSFADLGNPVGQSVLLIDVITDKGSTIDLMPEKEFNQVVLASILSLQWMLREDVLDLFSVRFPDAYPVLHPARYEAQERIEAAFTDTAVLLCGREASSDYNNAHNAISKGFLTARYISGELDRDEYVRRSRIIGRLPIQD